MGFTTVAFFIFVVAITIVYRLCPARFRPLLLAVASYGYYCTWSPKAALLLFIVTAAAFLAGRAITAQKSDKLRLTITLSLLVALLLFLIFFKLGPLMASLLKLPILVPLGISYYIFKLISYLLDVYWGNAAAETAFVPFAAYVAFFPQIVAGPIQRAGSFLSQMHKHAPARWSNIVWGAQRILLGCLKKFLIADGLAVLVDFIYAHLHAPGTPVAAAFYAYPIQIYADFSGLADIAIGVAWMLGIQSPENFIAPFAAPSPTEFWRRWHITLTTLLTDYVFTPLRMALRNFGNAGLVLSLFVTMTLIGLWHGFRWNYVVFGLLHGIYLTVDALTLRPRRRFYKAHPFADRLTDWTGPVFMFHLLAFSFIFFRADTVPDALYALQHLRLGIGSVSGDFAKLFASQKMVLLIAAIGYLIMEAADYIRRHVRQDNPFATLPAWRRWALYYGTTVFAVFLVLLLLGMHVNRTTFVYAMF